MTKEICSTFSDFFANSMSNLNITAIEHFHSNLENTDPILATVNSYDKHPSIKRIKNRSCNSTFSFNVTSNEVSKIIDNLTQWAFTCSKLTAETLEQGKKYVQS